MSHQAAIDADVPPVLGIDELARRCDTTVRTIREYQTLGLLPAPQKVGRSAAYDDSHVARLRTIARLQERGYSLAAIGDLLQAWETGHTLPGVLGVPAADVATVDEMPTIVDIAELARDMPAVFGTTAKVRNADKAGLIEREPDGVCVVRSPAMLQLVAEAVDAGLTTSAALGIVAAINDASAQIADVTVSALASEVEGRSLRDAPAALAAFRRGRSLLAQSAASMVIAHVGARMQQAVEGRQDLADLVEALRIGAIRDARTAYGKTRD